MNGFLVLSLIVTTMALVFGVRTYFWLRDGGAYYARYPGAKLLDDALAQGKMPEGGVYEMMDRLGRAKDLKTEIRSIRDELGIEDMKVG